MPEITRVGMGEYAIARAPGELVALGLGSCVGVCLYDPAIKLGALAHVMLPDSRMAKDGSKPSKFADTVIPFLLCEMERRGAARERMVVKIAGGARMFSGMNNDRESIGDRNVAVIERALAAEGLAPSARSIGGNYGKSLSLHLETGEVRLRTVQVESERL